MFVQSFPCENREFIVYRTPSLLCRKGGAAFCSAISGAYS